MGKKLLILFFAVYISVSLSGCGNSGKNIADTNKNNAAEDNIDNKNDTTKDS